MAEQRERIFDCDQHVHEKRDSFTRCVPKEFFELTGRLHRVTLVSDAGYCPGPTVGGSTTLAVVGAYVLAGEHSTAKQQTARPA
ncbi:hypothetical protein [Streptomyces sp. Agncl-13]|uniref:hypothetical protein n=1 Tax=Streptomyces sp. Agncl-13 TaxID=3400628 RepID=UPI003A839F48